MKNFLLPALFASAALVPCVAACDLNGALRFNGTPVNVGLSAANLVVFSPPPPSQTPYQRSYPRRGGGRVAVAGTVPGGLTPGATPTPAGATTPASGGLTAVAGSRPATTPATGATGGAATSPAPTATATGGEEAVPTINKATLFGGPTGGDDDLLGEVFFVAKTTTKLPDFSTLMSSGILFAPELNIPANEFSSGFPGVDSRSEYFAIRYEGPLTVANPGVYDLRLLSDKGAKVYINNTLVIDSDGVHPMAEKLGRVDLSVGVNVLRVEYLQTQGPRVALQLFVKSDKLTERPLRGRL
jgi:PA14 domain